MQSNRQQRQQMRRGNQDGSPGTWTRKKRMAQPHEAVEPAAMADQFAADDPGVLRLGVSLNGREAR